jgi:hypothetical protein
MKLPKYIVTILATILFVLLFFEQSLGLNVALYALGTILLLLVFKFEYFKAGLNKIVAIGYLLSSIFYYLYGSPLALVLAVSSFLLIIGLHTSSPLRNLLYAIPNTVNNFIESFSQFFSSFKGRKRKRKKIGVSKLVRIIFLPSFIILLFVALYSMGSTFFSDIIGQIGTYLNQILKSIAKYVDIEVIGVAILGLIFALVHSLGLVGSSVLSLDMSKTDVLTRIRKKYISRFRNLDLKYEYKSGVFLFASLNLLLMLLLFVEIKNVWMNFEWEGELLKSMVHEGTYVLIFSILVSIFVTIYYFRRNINFLKDNELMKHLAAVWIGLNAMLIVSVFIRNAYYIQNFALAYRRIGVIIFLLLCLVGLVTILMKIYQLKTTYYLIRINALAAYIVVVAVCSINWDVVIAKYNFKHYETAFIHLPYMAQLSDKALPYLSLSDEQIEKIESKQVEKIPFAKRGYFKKVGYKETIEDRIESFMIDYSERHWLESVWAEKRAYEKLKVNHQ